MTREEADFIGGMNMCDEISNEAYKKIMCHCEEQEPCDDAISRQAVLDMIENAQIITDGEFCGYCTEDIDINILPSAQPEWNNHTVACLLAELFDDTCACNYNGIDEWLPEKCELLDSCPNPVGVACWEQFLKHRAERRTDE